MDTFEASSQYRYAAKSDIGQVRARNEDAFLIDQDLGLYAVADGMGGHQAGDVASSLSLDALKAALAAEQTASDHEFIAQSLQNANKRVFDESVARGLIQGMGTTLTALWLRPDRSILIGHVGDSRCYRLRNNELERITRDHSWVQVQIDEGLLTETEAAKHPMRNVVTRSIGFESQIEVDVYEPETESGDTYLLATDGLTGKMNDADLKSTLNEYVSQSEDKLDECADALLACANERGGEDNITVVLLQFI